jgi:hypothetical protein
MRDGIDQGPAECRPGFGQTVDRVHYLCPCPLVQCADPGQARVGELINEDTDLIIAHSLGSIVGWESCHRYKGNLPMLLTIGSPLGLGSVLYP